MTEISFYHFTQGSFEKTLAKLLEKVYASNTHAVLLVETPEQQEELNTFLWTYNRDDFLPHGTAQEGFAELQPIWLTTQLENPNQASILVSLTKHPLENVGTFKRCLDFFNGHDDDAVTQARIRWKNYKNAGHNLTYWQQSETGKWEKKDL
jgi:DNA polymerase III, chi subunit